MAFDIVKYERGQVWVIRFKNPTYVGHEQSKDRPWLILSVGKFNQSSKMITAVPITSRDKAVSPAQVLFTNEKFQKNVILCEQVHSFDYSSGAYILDYMGQVSDEVLEQVDVAISIHLGLHYSPITLKKLYDSMEAIIKSVGYMQKKADTPKFTDKDVLQFAEKLQMLAGTPATEETCASQEVAVSQESEDNPNDMQEVTLPDSNGNPKTLLIPKQNMKDFHKVEEPKKEEVPKKSTTVDTKTRSPRINWTKERCEEFFV